ncbi:MAG: hypothetical protein IH946_04645 [Bacteroidetes bacterium]|nr:hypothetical protein [Bacteroidota bacterium]
MATGVIQTIRNGSDSTHYTGDIKSSTNSVVPFTDQAITMKTTGNTPVATDAVIYTLDTGSATIISDTTR